METRECAKLPRRVPRRQFKPRIAPGPKFPAKHILHKVRDVLEKHPEGVTLRQLSREADVEWETATKYINYMQDANETTAQWVGRAKLVRQKAQSSSSISKKPG